MAQMKKNPVSGKTVKTTTYSILTPFKKNVKMVNERTTRKPVVKTTAKPTAKAKPKGSMVQTNKTTKKAPGKKQIVQMPSKISPFKMTPAQKAEYLKNPERYDG